MSNTAAVNWRFEASSHFVPTSTLCVFSGGNAWLFTPVAASVRPSVPSNEGVNDVL